MKSYSNQGNLQRIFGIKVVALRGSARMGTQVVNPADPSG